MSAIDPDGLKTTLVTTYDYGFGTHSAILIETEGMPPLLYDPAGTFPKMGSGDTMEDVTLDQYVKYQKSTGSRVVTTVLNTTVDQEKAMRKWLEGNRGMAPGFCASGVSSALNGACGIGGSMFPGTLKKQAEKAKCP